MGTTEQMTEQDLHKSRLAFAVIADKCVFTLNDCRSHWEWLSQDYEVTKSDFENIVRSYVFNDNIYLYKGSDFVEIADSEIESSTLVEIVQQANIYNKWKYSRYIVYSGMTEGNIGEVWKPVRVLCSVNVAQKN